MEYRFLPSLLLLAALVAGGCAPMQGGRTSNNLADQVNRHEQQIQTILSQVGNVEQVLPGQAEIWSQMQNMRQELNTMHGQLDSLQTQASGGGGGEVGVLQERVRRLETVIRQMGSQLGINVDAIDAPLPTTAPVNPEYTTPQATNNTDGYDTPPLAPEAPPAVIPPTATPPVPAANTNTATILYDSGIKAFDERRYQDAVAVFKDFSNTFPKHTLSSNACFWEGESYYQLKDYGRAALAYQNVIEKYPSSSKVQSAMLKQGMALYHAGKKAAAKERLQGLVSSYPKSPESTRAKQFMQKNK